jgi:hypothetical protein
MATITSVATWKTGTNAIAISVTIGNKTFTRNHVNIPANATEAQLESAARTWATANNVTLGEFHIHINVDRSLAIAIGPAPDVWPEDSVG